jgi:ABC-type dipeptide/oligopeptide/nickel transport system permease component
MTFAISGISFPSFALGMVLMQLFSVQLGWLPTVGADSLAPLHPAVADARAPAWPR